MKKLFPVLVFLCWLTLPGRSQAGPGPQPPMRGNLQVLKMAFISQQLNLTPDEAQKFWPIYNNYIGEVRKANGSYKRDGNELELDEALLNIKKKYSVEFLKAISPGKINDFFKAEKDFAALVRREMQRRQLQRRPYPDQ